MQTEEQKNRQDLFGLLSKWSSLLPSDGEQSPSSLENLNNVGKEIHQLCAQTERNGLHTLMVLPEVKKEAIPETDFKPSFVFQLTTDDLINPQQAQFDCVFDFCEKLADYCKTSTTKHLNIEKDWLKLLLACSSNNYERFMWIHLTFQSTNNLKLDWQQVKKRLMCKFDHPSRPAIVLNLVSSFKYLPEIETIELANERFSKLAAEAQIDVTDAYLLGLPSHIKDVISSTMAFDATTSFHCGLKDVQQRATIFLTANEGDFIFYSKTAHVALRLEHEKVNKKDCEFHLLAEHSTSTCPDYVIVKYPYMEFTSLAGVPKLHSPTTITKYTQSVEMEKSSEPFPQPAQPFIPMVQAQVQTQPSLNIAGSSSFTPVQTTDQVLSVKQENTNGTREQPVEDLAMRIIAEAIAAANETKQKNEEQQRDNEIKNMTSLQVVERAKHLSETGQSFPDVLKARVIQLKEQMLNQPISPPRKSRRSESPYRSSSRRRSPSPRRRYRDRSSSQSPSTENGCYVHGMHATHSTKDCRQAQMVIPSRFSPNRRSASPGRNSRKLTRKEPSNGEDNICIFCKLPFKPGHLGYCKEVRGKKKVVRRR